jgi:hypothetical protein
MVGRQREMTKKYKWWRGAMFHSVDRSSPRVISYENGIKQSWPGVKEIVDHISYHHPFWREKRRQIGRPPPYKEWRGAQVLILSSRHDTHESFITPESISSNNSQSSYWKSITLYFSYYLFYIYIYILSNKFSILLFVFFKYYFV